MSEFLKWLEVLYKYQSIYPYTMQVHFVAENLPVSENEKFWIIIYASAAPPACLPLLKACIISARINFYDSLYISTVLLTLIKVIY